jgi:hypothetical protein
MPTYFTRLSAALSLAVAFASVASAQVFINEIHYDNDGADANEAVEIAGLAGTDLAGWSLVYYNGSGGASYATDALSGVLSDQQGGFGTIVVERAGIQNGAPDGIALVDASNTVVQFLSYEGVFVATNGPANGLTSTDIGVIETGSGPADSSLQLTACLAGCREDHRSGEGCLLFVNGTPASCRPRKLPAGCRRS